MHIIACDWIENMSRAVSRISNMTGLPLEDVFIGPAKNRDGALKIELYIRESNGSATVLDRVTVGHMEDI